MYNKISKFGVMTAVTVLTLIFLASCEMPQSARIKASPTLQIPIPMGDGGLDTGLMKSFSLEGIRDQLGKEEVYKYEVTDKKEILGIEAEEGKPVQTYLVISSVYDKDLDFSKNIDGLNPDPNKVPPVKIEQEAIYYLNQAYLGLVSYEELPFDRWVDPFMGTPLKIDLGDMENLVSDITFETNTSFSIIVDLQNAEMLQKAIRIRIPQLKIGAKNNMDKNSWVKGELNGDRTRLIFKSAGINHDEPLLLLSDGTDSEKKEASGKIEIYVKLANLIDAGTYKSELNFDWYSAKVDPKVEGGEIDLNSYLDSLGSGVEFEKVPGYLYLTVPPDLDPSGSFKDDIDISIPGADRKNLDDIIKPARSKTKDENGDIPLSVTWLDDNPSEAYDLTLALKKNQNTIKYDLKSQSSVTIYKGQGLTGKITVKLALLLPMSFNFTGDGITIDNDDPDTDEDERGTYYPIKFEDLDEFLGTGDDGGEESFMEDINDELGGEGVNGLFFRVGDIKNNLTSPIYMAVGTDMEQDEWKVVKLVDGNSKDFPVENVQTLTQLPPVKFLVKQDNGRLYIKARDDQPPDGEEPAESADFKFKLSVVAGIDLDKKL